MHSGGHPGLFSAGRRGVVLAQGASPGNAGTPGDREPRRGGACSVGPNLHKPAAYCAPGSVRYAHEISYATLLPHAKRPGRRRLRGAGQGPCKLEAQGREVVHMEIGEPDFPTAPHVVEAAKRALDAGYTKYGPTQGRPGSCARPSLSTSPPPAASRSDESQVIVTPGAKPVLFLPYGGAAQARRRGDVPQPGVSDLRIHHQLLRRDARAAATGRGARLFAGPGPLPRLADRQDQARSS